MSQEYSVPKREVRGRILLAGQAPVDVSFFLGTRAETHDGPERASDLLNGTLTFLPARDEHGRVLLINRDALQVVSIDASNAQGMTDDEEVSDLLDLTHVKARIILDGGANIEGTVRYLLPDSQRRLQDFLNRCPRFITVRQEHTVHLINKHHIAQVFSD